jgi:hypothetical protein
MTPNSEHTPSGPDFAIGDRVTFQGQNGHEEPGEIIATTPRAATVHFDSGYTFQVKKEMLSHSHWQPQQREPSNDGS